MDAMMPADPSPPRTAGSRPAAPRGTSGGPARLDASMTLLLDVMEQPLDPGYAAAARERMGRGSPAVVAVTVVLALLCGYAVTRSVGQLNAPQPDAVASRQKLESEIRGRIEAADERQLENEALRADIVKQQNAALQSAGGLDLARQVEELSIISGELPVAGAGLQITLDDAKSSSDPAAGNAPRNQVQADQGRVLDRDLQIVVNGLWTAGAEAIAINGQRLTSLSAIRQAGQAILVDFRPLGPPYVVQAIGNPRGLESGFAADMAGSYVQSISTTYGIQVGIQTQTSMELRGAGTLVLRYAQPVTPASPSSGAPSPGVTP
jgi:uncharacterized protein YlxW (UPF0749 family)